MDDKTLLIVIILFLIVVSILIIKYGRPHNGNHNSYDRDEENDNYEDSSNVDNKRTEQFYDDLEFTFPSLEKVDDPIDTLKYLFENKTKVTEEMLNKHCNGVSNFKNDNGVISFDTESTHFDFNTARSEVKIDDLVEVSSNRSGLFFSEEDKSLSMAFHKEQGEYIIDDYSINNPEGISHNIEDGFIEKNNDISENNSTIDNEIIASDTSY